MRYLIVNQTKQAVLATRGRLAAHWWERAIGLLRESHLEPEEALILPGAAAIHTVGMRFAIDVIVVDRQGTVLAMVSGLPPGRFSPWWRRARAVIECPVGAIQRSATQVGDRMVWSQTQP
ncbi:MAG: DUF192 domain-containing protein [Candidatus Omnitrophica bacterium]|nr:DUF192 domain-containing protein [Candidatus Omnitrophota bacterium]